MIVKSVNLGKAKIVSWRGKQVKTGIYKYPVDEPIELGIEDVVSDAVVDRKYHGGPEKACYLYSADHYPYWKSLYPKLEWNYGMFGENITIEGLNEDDLIIGDVYQLGEAKVQITQPREPCYKLGIRFGTQKVVKQFLNKSFCGSYIQILKTGVVKPGDTMQLLEANGGQLSIAKLYDLFFGKDVNVPELKKAAQNSWVTENNMKNLKNRLKIMNIT